jgi:hypothetical protein
VWCDELDALVFVDTDTGTRIFLLYEFIRVFHFDFAQYRPIRVNNSFGCGFAAMP